MNSRVQSTREPIRLLVVAAVLTLSIAAAVLWWRGRVSALTLVGERAGVMVWRSVPNATEYHLELVDESQAVVYRYAEADTVGPLPPWLSAPAQYTWRVRAFNGRQLVAESERARLY